jgi:hypothetical protein
VLLDAAERSRQQMHSQLESICAAQIPGDTYRHLVIHPQYSAQTFKHILVPIWLLTYTYGATAYQVVVNGCTGRIAGKYPISMWKVVLLVLAALVVIALFAIVGQE